MDRAVAFTEDTAGEHMGPVGDDFVDVHVGLGAGTGLPHHEGEAMVEVSGDDFLANADDQVSLGFGQHPRSTIGLGSGHLEVAKGMDHFNGHAAHRADGEVVAAALRLGAPILVGRHGDFAERVLFNPGLHGMWIRNQACSAARVAAACMRLALSMASMSPLRTASLLDVS